MSAQAEIVEIAGKSFVIETHQILGDTMYGCSWLPLRATRAALIDDITRSQGPEWRK